MPMMATERKLGDQLDFSPVQRPRRAALRGDYVTLRPVVADEDAERLYAESHPPLADPGLWTYMPGGPYRDAADLRDALRGAETSSSPWRPCPMSGRLGSRPTCGSLLSTR
jgi:hypothetical protein